MNYQKYIDEHKKLYKDLDSFLSEFTKLKNSRNDKFLIETAQEFIAYIENLLIDHFAQEEKELFPKLKNVVNDIVIERISQDHIEINSKFEYLKQSLSEFIKNQNQDYKIKLLFPCYNLIATINHHAQREDREIFFAK